MAVDSLYGDLARRKISGRGWAIKIIYNHHAVNLLKCTVCHTDMNYKYLMRK